MSRYAVKIMRGRPLELPPHPLACELGMLRRYTRETGRPLVIDLFSGAGGLSLGLEEAGFEVVLGVDRDQHAIMTRRAYFGGASLCADLSRPDVVKGITRALKGIPVALVAGGPPCQPFSRAGRSKIRSLVDRGARLANDDRRELWRSFVDVVECLRPQGVLVENVPDLALGHDAVVLRRMVAALEELGYDVHTRILPAWQYGVPQYRQRLFLVGLERGLPSFWPRPQTTRRPTVRDAISDLPAIEAGARQVELPYRGARTPFQRWYRRGVGASERRRIYDHIARPVREDDLEAFRLMDHQTRYSDLPPQLQRYRADIFRDKYKRLHWDEPSRTITAHIGQDGYWYIHPEQHRSLSLREAARLQSFPDWFRFAGGPSHAFRQIGEAVPPILARALGRAVLRALEAGKRSRWGASTSDLSNTLSQWLEGTPEIEMAAPWRRSGNLWHTLLGMVLFERLPSALTRAFWPTYRGRWPEPEAFLGDPRRDTAMRAIGRAQVGQLLTKIAQTLLENRRSADSVDLKVPGLPPDRLALARTLCGLSHQRPPTSAAIRVAERVLGEPTEGSRLTAQLLLARLVGVDESGRAHAAMLEVADRFCKPPAPECDLCPLRQLCSTGLARRGKASPIP